MSAMAMLVDTEVSVFGKHSGHGIVECAGRVLGSLLARHPALAQRVGSVWLGTARPGSSDGRENGLAVSVAAGAALPPVPCVDVHAYCASGNAAVYRAASDVRNGEADVAIAIGVEHMTSYPRDGVLVPEAVPTWAAGFSPPVYYALCANRYLHEYDADVTSLAQVTVRNRAYAAANPKAMMREPVNVEQVLSSRLISTPLTLYQCCPNADGAGAAILASEQVLEEVEPSWSEAVRVEGMGWATATRPEYSSLVSFDEDIRSSSLAYEDAGRGPDDVDVVELHDAFSIAQAIHLEDLGLAERGAGTLVGSRQEDVVVNPSGGLLGRGHPLGATGLAQFDAVRRWLATGRGRIGMVHEAGGLQLVSQMLSISVLLGSRDQEES